MRGTSYLFLNQALKEVIVPHCVYRYTQGRGDEVTSSLVRDERGRAGTRGRAT
jgi:hypothetical protein